MRKMCLTATLVIAILGAGFGTTAGGAELADVSMLGNEISWTSLSSQRLVLRVSQPDGKVLTFDVEDGSFSFVAELDGSHTWELTAVAEVDAATLEAMAALRDSGELISDLAPARVQDGHFLVEAGQIVVPDPELEEPILKEVTSLSAPVIENLADPDQVILDDLIVDGSLCVGQDCVNGESFGFDTIRLKENNLRIKAQDTSNSGSFPSNDWQLTFNDSTNGGANKFSIDDVDGGRTPFTIEAGTPSNALYVDSGGSGGRIGFGTNSPVVDLHVKSGNTPTLRLEQDGSSGFTAQTWDLAGNEANLFIRDVTNGSTLPFRIFPDAPTDALTIEGSTGDIGVGTNSPADALHVVRSGGSESAAIRVEAGGNNATVRFLAASGRDWLSGLTNASDEFNIRQVAGNVTHFSIKANGNATLAGTLTEMSDRNRKTNIVEQDGRQVLDILVGVPIAMWEAKSNVGYRHMGPMAQDFYAAFGLGQDDVTISPLDVGGVAISAIQGLYEVVQEKDAALEALQQENADLAARLAALEELVLENR